MSIAESLQQVDAVFSQLHELLMEENTLLRHTQLPPSDAFLEKKGAILGTFESAIASLKSIQRVPQALKHPLIVLEQKLMKVLGLLRENEQLLLNNPMMAIQGKHPPAAACATSVQIQRIAKLYGQGMPGARKDHEAP